MNGNTKYLLDELNEKIVGGRITSTIATTDGESFGIRVEVNGKRFNCWIDCDPEGNGPGFVGIEEVPA